MVVVMPPRIAAKLSGIINRPADQPMRIARVCMIGMNITTTGVLFRNALVIRIAAKPPATLRVGRRFDRRTKAFDAPVKAPVWIMA